MPFQQKGGRGMLAPVYLWPVAGPQRRRTQQRRISGPELNLIHGEITMKHSEASKLSRRTFLASAAVGALHGPFMICRGAARVSKPMTRQFGRTGYAITSLGLGGQASLQWTPGGIDPEKIILKAFDLGVTYFDTSNVYGPSQMNYGRAFRTLGLVPGVPGYKEAKRRGIVLASKTMVRHAIGSHPDIADRSEGPKGSKAVDDLRRSLSQMFGDGQGNYPKGAYLDIFQIHNLNTMAEVEAIYFGLDKPDPKAERMGAFAALKDFRDGTNFTGLNSKEEKLIRHIGITGHISSPVMIECLQRDNQNIIDTMLIAINANDRLYLSHQYNAIPVAAARNLGIIAMKVFADGAMYTKEPKWSRTPEDVVLTVGSPALPSRPLVEYALSTPGISTAIIGIGRIDQDDRNCQLVQNMASAQIRPAGLAQTDREAAEQKAAQVRAGKTNWFQLAQQPLSAPRDAAVAVQKRGDQRTAALTWQTAYAADNPISHYEILRDGQKVGQVGHKPQTSKAPFAFEDKLTDQAAHEYKVVTIDKAGRRAETSDLRIAST
jgi:aryl-alcohol dehydrogenase-like predicted oxidoreductase